jgi:hypothetical protein
VILVPAAIVGMGLLPIVILLRRASSQLHPLRVEVRDSLRGRTED